MSGRQPSFQHAARSPVLVAPGPPGMGPGVPSVTSVDEDPVLVGYLQTARSLGLAALTILTAALVLTGGLLFALYAPSGVGATGTSAGIGRTLSDLHLVLAWLAMFVASFTGVAVLFERGLARRWFSASLGPLTALVGLAALVSGLPLGWNDLSVVSGGPGPGTTGYRFLVGEGRGVVLTDYGQVTVAALGASMGLHIVAGTALVVVATMVWQLRNEAPPELTEFQQAERLARRPGSSF